MNYLIAHLIGDFLLQNHWMQGKTKAWWPCAVHVAVYMVPWVFVGLPVWALVAIAVQHALQDRYRIAGAWSRLIRQTPADVWPQGPLWIDQSMHAAWCALVIWLSS